MLRPVNINIQPAAARPSVDVGPAPPSPCAAASPPPHAAGPASPTQSRSAKRRRSGRQHPSTTSSDATEATENNALGPLFHAGVRPPPRQAARAAAGPCVCRVPCRAYYNSMSMRHPAHHG